MAGDKFHAGHDGRRRLLQTGQARSSAFQRRREGLIGVLAAIDRPVCESPCSLQLSRPSRPPVTPYSRGGPTITPALDPRHAVHREGKIAGGVAPAPRNCDIAGDNRHGADAGDNLSGCVRNRLDSGVLVTSRPTAVQAFATRPATAVAAETTPSLTAVTVCCTFWTSFGSRTTAFPRPTACWPDVKHRAIPDWSNSSMTASLTASLVPCRAASATAPLEPSLKASKTQWNYAAIGCRADRAGRSVASWACRY